MELYNAGPWKAQKSGLPIAKRQDNAGGVEYKQGITVRMTPEELESEIRMAGVGRTIREQRNREAELLCSEIFSNGFASPKEPDYDE